MAFNDYLCISAGESLDVVAWKAWTVTVVFYGGGSGIMTSDAKYLIIPLLCRAYGERAYGVLWKMRWKRWK